MAMSQRFFAPAFKVEINGATLAADVSKNITDVSAIHELDTTDHFSLTIANPYPKMRWTHTSDADLFKEGSAIRIEMGYVDNLQVMVDGEITSISPSFPESGTPTVRVEGHSRLHRLQGSGKTRTFQDVTDKEIVERIARDLNLSPQAEETKTKHPYVIQFNQTDLDFLKERAQYIHFEVLVEGTTLIFRKAKEDQSKAYTLVWGSPSKSFDATKSVLPLKHFNPTLNTLHQVNEVIVRGYDPKNKKPITGRAGAGDETTTMGGSQTGAQVAAQAFGSTREEVRVDTPIASQEEADQRARAVYNQRALQLVTGSGSTIGLPDLRAGRVIELDGLGPRFSGLYYVTQATHSISSGGYLTTFSVKRNAVS
jgi:phage protein D